MKSERSIAVPPIPRLRHPRKDPAALAGAPGRDRRGRVPDGISLAIAEGADIKVVQQMLGHKSATMTWDLYGHLFPNRLQEVAEVLDTGARAAGMYKACTKSEVMAHLLAA
jgi:integrase